jgi:hypothetical protein
MRPCVVCSCHRVTYRAREHHHGAGSDHEHGCGFDCCRPGEVDAAELVRKREELRVRLREKAQAADADMARRREETLQLRRLVQGALAYASSLEKEGKI